MLAAYGVRVVQTWGWSPTLVHPDETTRVEEVNRLAAALRLAADFGADGVTLGCGSLNPLGGYWPHPANFSDTARLQLIRSLRDVAPIASNLGVTVALEGHVLTTLNTPERVRDILEAVDSPAVGVNLDPVNFVADLPTLYTSSSLVERVFEALGPFAIAGHVKDVYAENRLVVHLSETLIGDGDFDVRNYLIRFEELLPDGYMFIEHLPEDMVGRARAVLDSLLADVGIEVRE
jgi:L-ribulose-5-phosphate 3-epimerase